MDFLKKNKTVTAVAILAIFVLLYFLFYSFSGSSTPSTIDSSNTDAVSQSLLVTLSNLHTIRLDGSVFQNPVFVSLTDFGVVIPPEATGRRNPFSPITSVSSAAQATQTTTSGK